MSAIVQIVLAGPGVTLQDSGRWGYLRYGVTQAGPMDALAHEFANRMAGNDPGAAGIEISVGGLDLVVAEAALELAIVAPGFRVAHDGAPLPSMCLVTLAPGEKLSVRAGESGAWAYVAWRDLGNPVFPLFNAMFHSPEVADTLSTLMLWLTRRAYPMHLSTSNCR